MSPHAALASLGRRGIVFGVTEVSVSRSKLLLPAVENVTLPAVENVTLPAVENVTLFAVENVTLPAVENVTLPAVENVTLLSAAACCHQPRYSLFSLHHPKRMPRPTLKLCTHRPASDKDLPSSTPPKRGQPCSDCAALPLPNPKAMPPSAAGRL